MLVGKREYRMEPGNYLLKILAVDSLLSDRKDSITFELPHRPFPPTVMMSEIELCSNIQVSENKTDPFFKNSLELLPNPKGRF